MHRLWFFCVLLVASAMESDETDIDGEIIAVYSNYTCQLKFPGEIECEVGGVTISYENKADEVVDPASKEFWIDLIAVLCITLVSGAMSGLTIGLVGLDLTNLEILHKSGTPEERVLAGRVLPLVRKHHLTLVTLLLMNAFAMETLPIFLEHLVPPVLAIIFSVTLILLFGEIIPQALCARWGLTIGAYSAWAVWLLIGLTFPISWPISKLLDCVIGVDHQTYFKRAELKELIAMHEKRNLSVTEDNKETVVPVDEGLSYDEVSIIKGALDMTDKKVVDVLTPLAKCFMLNINEVLNHATLKLIKEEGHSRVPVYKDSRQHVIGMILAKNLIVINPKDNITVGSVHLQPLPHVSSSTPLYSIMNIFRVGRSHMALVIDESDCLMPLGVITLENVIEELIQEDIADETDRKRYANMRKKGIEGAVDDFGATQGWLKGAPERKKGKGKERDRKGPRHQYDTDSSGYSDDDLRDRELGDDDSDLSTEASSDDLDAHFRHIIEQSRKRQLRQPLQEPDSEDGQITREELITTTTLPASHSPRDFLL